MISTILDNFNLTTNKSLSKIQQNDENEIEMDPYVPYTERIETYIIPVLLAAIFIVGVLGNGTLVIIFFRHRSMRNIPNTYILSLALADLLVIIICVPLGVIVYTSESWPWGATLCRVTECAKDISIGVSVFTLTALSAERYCAIVNPLRKLQTKPLTVVTAAVIWLIAILFAMPAAIVSDTDEAISIVNVTTNTTILITYCTPYGKYRENIFIYRRYMAILKALVYYIIPLFIIGALYILMAKRLHISAREMPGEISGPQSRTQARARRHVAKMVVAFVIVFFCCFFPYHMFSLWFNLNPNAPEEFNSFWHALRIIGFCTSYLNSCANPVTLYCVSGVFRQHFNHYLCCRPMNEPYRLGHHSSATGPLNTSFISMRHSTNYNRSSMHGNNNSVLSNYHRNLQRQQSLQLHQSVINSNGGASPTQSIILSDKR